MRKAEWVLREILYRVYEENEFFMSQKSLAETCGVSLDTVNKVVGRLEAFRSLEKKPFGFRVVEPKKILLYWAATRDLRGEILYSTYSPHSPAEIEEALPENALLTAFSGCRRRFGCTEDYEEVYVYCPPEPVRKKFGERTHLPPNLFVLQGDPHLYKRSREGVPSLAQIYVDLWQIGGTHANRHLMKLERKMELRPVEVLKELARTAKEGNRERETPEVSER
ncbi:MAG: replication/maintenance protein RepL [Candidatus Hadarchaeales archaeon]